MIKCTIAAALLCLYSSWAWSSEPAALEKTPDEYAAPGTLVRISEQRSLNMRCSGSGPATAILEAGTNSDSTTWFRVQSLLAKKMRACSYDRAGYGFSDEGPMPRGLGADVSDLRALITASGIKAPVILVGHSLGANIVRRYAELYRTDVVGMVLVDPPEQNVSPSMPAKWRNDGAIFTAQRDAFLEKCLIASTNGNDEDLSKCIRKTPEWISSSASKAIRLQKSRPPYWRTLRSELSQNVALFSQPVSSKEQHGSLPILLLTASETYRDESPEVRSVLESVRSKTHAQIAATSSNSAVQMVLRSTHDVQLDQPAVVVQAVDLVRQKAKAVRSTCRKPNNSFKPKPLRGSA